MLLDNKTTGKVGDELGKSIKKDARLSMLSSLFSVYGYEALRKELSRVASVRLLLPAGVTTGSGGGLDGFRVAGLVGTEVDRRLRNSLDLTKIARECAEWLEQKAEVRAVTIPVPQNLFHVANGDGDGVAVVRGPDGQSCSWLRD